jgi:hypothetical protein
VIEAQRRIHELEAQREQERRVEETRPEEPRAQRESPRAEPPAFLIREEISRPEQPAEQARESRAEPRVEPRPQPRAEPRVEPKKLLEEAGLVMIETDRAKAPPPAPVAEEPAQLGRPRREKPRAGPEDEPLQQVETKH